MGIAAGVGMLVLLLIVLGFIRVFRKRREGKEERRGPVRRESRIEEQEAWGSVEEIEWVELGDVEEGGGERV